MAGSGIPTRSPSGEGSTASFARNCCAIIWRQRWHLDDVQAEQILLAKSRKRPRLLGQPKPDSMREVLRSGVALSKNTSAEAGFSKCLPDGTTYNAANGFSAHRFPAEGATAKGLPVESAIGDSTLPSVGIQTAQYSRQRISSLQNWGRRLSAGGAVAQSLQVHI